MLAARPISPSCMRCWASRIQWRRTRSHFLCSLLFSCFFLLLGACRRRRTRRTWLGAAPCQRLLVRRNTTVAVVVLRRNLSSQWWYLGTIPSSAYNLMCRVAHDSKGKCYQAHRRITFLPKVNLRALAAAGLHTPSCHVRTPYSPCPYASWCY